MTPEVEKLCKQALDVARSGNVAIVIVPDMSYAQSVLNPMAQMIRMDDPIPRATSSELHFEGTRGSVRIYPVTHITYDPKQKRLMDYPAGIQHFLHPEVEGL